MYGQFRKKNKDLWISARKAEILKSVRFAKYETRNFWQQFKLEQKKSSICGLVCGFYCFFKKYVRKLLSFLLTEESPHASVSWFCPAAQVAPAQWQHGEEQSSSHWGGLLISHQKSLHGGGGWKMFSKLQQRAQTLLFFHCTYLQVSTKKVFVGFFFPASWRRLKTSALKQKKSGVVFIAFNLTYPVSLWINGKQADLHHAGY